MTSNNLVSLLQEHFLKACVNGCKRDGFVCMDACPCHSECPIGCLNCDSWACNACEDPSINENVIQVG